MFFSHVFVQPYKMMRNDVLIRNVQSTWIHNGSPTLPLWGRAWSTSTSWGGLRDPRRPATWRRAKRCWSKQFGWRCDTVTGAPQRKKHVEKPQKVTIHLSCACCATNLFWATKRIKKILEDWATWYVSQSSHIAMLVREGCTQPVEVVLLLVWMLQISARH